MKKGVLSLLTLLTVLLLDQALKFWVKTNMYMGEEIRIIGDYFRLHFTENEGMAFGMSYGGETGKLVLSVIRIVIVSVIAFLLIKAIRKKMSTGVIICGSLVLAGALGNIIDSVFYGVFFEASYHHKANIAQFLPQGGGYADYLHGKVVDMLYFPLIDTYLPEWVPIIGGYQFQFFKPVFNIADSSIFLGLIISVLFYREKIFGKSEKRPRKSQRAYVKSNRPEIREEEVEIKKAHKRKKIAKNKGSIKTGKRGFSIFGRKSKASRLKKDYEDLNLQDQDIKEREDAIEGQLSDNEGRIVAGYGSTQYSNIKKDLSPLEAIGEYARRELARMKAEKSEEGMQKQGGGSFEDPGESFRDEAGGSENSGNEPDGEYHPEEPEK